MDADRQRLAALRRGQEQRSECRTSNEQTTSLSGIVLALQRAWRSALLLSLLAFQALAADLSPAVEAAAAEFDVPVDILSALIWEASRFDPDAASAWGGYGPADLREDRTPNVEDAAILLDLSADALIDDPTQNIRGAAALLAEQADHLGQPDVDDLESWWDAVRVFSGSHDPEFQERFAKYVFETVYRGVNSPSPDGTPVRFGGVPIDLPGLVAMPALPPPGNIDYAGAAAFTAACGANYTAGSRTGSDINYVVIHTVQGSYSGAIGWFANCDASVSAHYVVRSSDGEITQTVGEDDIAWHAGNWTYNQESVGIEHEGYVDDPGYWYTDDMYAASAALTSDIITRTNATADRNHIIAHSEVPGATHTDPGVGWDWAYYMSLIDGTAAVAGTLTGVVALDDVFTGQRLAGVEVVLEETGEVVETDETGTYAFTDVTEGEHTARVELDGYEPATCTKDVDTSSTFWCSIALIESVDIPDGDEEDEGIQLTPDPGAIHHPSFADLLNPGPVAEAPRGCGCATANPGFAWFALLLPLLFRRR